jgi:hypothetical protein
MSDAAKIEVKDKVLTFGKYDAEEVEIGDDGLIRYINLENILSPRSKEDTQKDNSTKQKYQSQNAC